jgi:hypothetical protein
MTEVEAADEVVMNGDAIHLIHSIMGNALKNKKFSEELRKNWENDDLVAEDAFFEDVFGNKPLMRTMTGHLANVLSDDLTTSIWGLGLVTDHELYFQGKTDEMLNTLLASKGIALTHAKFLELRKKRNLVFKFVRDTKDQAVINMDYIGKFYSSLFYNRINKPFFIGSPATLEELRKQPPVKPKGKVDIAKEIAQDEAKLKKVTTSSTAALLSQVPEDELADNDVVLHEKAFVLDEARVATGTVETDEALTDLSGDVGEKRKRSGKTLVEQLCEAYPNVKTTGVFVFIDEDDTILFASDELNIQFLSSFAPSK